ncbi:MAG: integrase [Psychroserpens sp.]|jgi:integrase
MDRRKIEMTIRQVKNGYVMDFKVGQQRYRQTFTVPHTKTIEKKLSEQEALYKFAIINSDKSYLEKYPNSKILQKAFYCESDLYTIDQYSSIWFKQKQRNWSHTTKRVYSQKYNHDIKPNFGHIRLKEFKGSMFDDWAARKTLSGKSINEIRSILNQIFKRAFNDGVIDINPIQRIERYKQEHKEVQPFCKEEIHKILSVLETPYREFYQFSIWTGLRTGELLGLRWQDVDLKKGVVHIRKSISRGVEKDPKNKGSIRTIELQPNAAEALNIIKRSIYFDNYRVFINPKDNQSFKDADGIRETIWKPALERQMVEYRYPYTCRHTFASMMLSNGKNPMWVAAQMGHADWGMIRKTYGRWISN